MSIVNVDLGYVTNIRICAEPVLLPDTLVLNITSTTYVLHDLIVHVRSSEGEKKVRTVPGEFDLTPYLTPGMLQVSVCWVEGGETVKQWHILPFAIKEADGGLLCVDKISELDARLAALEAKTTVIM